MEHALAQSTQVLNAEQALLGCLLTDSSRMDELDLSQADFSRGGHGRIFDAIKQLYAGNQATDAVTVCDQLERTHQIEACGGQAYIGSLANCASSAANVTSYARLVKEYSTIRRAMGILDRAAEDVRQGGVPAIDRAAAELLELAGRTAGQHEASIGEATFAAIERLDFLEKHPGLVGVTTGLVDLDEKLGGFQGGDLYIVGARPSMGKTSLLLNFAVAAAKAAVPVGLFSTEQPAIQIGQRTLALEGKVIAARMRIARLDEVDWRKIANAFEDVRKLPVWINDKHNATIADVARQARWWRNERKIGAFYVDYIQRIRGSDPKATRTDEVSEVAKELKSLARELDIPVIALAQVLRDVDKRQDKRPGMADLSNSSEIEKEADVIMTLYRDEVYVQESRDHGKAEIIVCKNRHGPTGWIWTTWLAEYMAFENMLMGEMRTPADD